MESEYRSKEVQFIAVNACDVDSLDDMAEHAYDFSIEYPVTKDYDFGLVRALGVTRTPEVVVLDEALEVRYQGRIDDQYRLGGARHTPETHELDEALDAVLAGKTVAMPKTQAEGCVVTFPDEYPATVEVPRRDEPLRDMGEFEHQLHTVGAPHWDDITGAFICQIESVSEQALWIRGLTLQCTGSPGMPALGLFYTASDDPLSRHYLCGPLTEGKPLRWENGEAMYLPGSAMLYLLLPGNPLSDVTLMPSLRCEVAKETVRREIQCELAVAALHDRATDSPTSLEFSRAPVGTFRAIALYASDYGACATLQISGAPGSPDQTIAFPLLRPALPSNVCREPCSAEQGKNEQVKVLIRSPGYLAYPTAHSEQKDTVRSAERGRETVSVFIYFSSPVTSSGK